MNLWLIKRNGSISDMVELFEYDVNTDYITSEKASFTISKNDVAYDTGDFVMAKYPNGGGMAYLGLIESYENNKIICNEIVTLVNFEFPATKFTGNSFEQHAKNLITKYLISDTNKAMNILDIDVKTNTSHIYQPAEPPTPTNLMKYLINGFKKYNVVWRFEGFVNGRIKTSITAVSDKIQLKNNIASFVNWNVSTTAVGKGTENHVLIVNKNTTNSENPNILAQWWLQTDNEVTSNASSALISRPTKTVVNIYDTTATEKPSYEDIAKSELKGNVYSHEITVDAYKDNDLMDVTSLRIGTLVTLKYGDTLYNSVLTGFQNVSGSDFIELRFGHIRSRLTELLE